MLSDKQEQGVADLELGIEGVSIPIPAPVFCSKYCDPG